MGQVGAISTTFPQPKHWGANKKRSINWPFGLPQLNKWGVQSCDLIQVLPLKATPRLSSIRLTTGIMCHLSCSTPSVEREVPVGNLSLCLRWPYGSYCRVPFAPLVKHNFKASITQGRMVCLVVLRSYSDSGRRDHSRCSHMKKVKVKR